MMELILFKNNVMTYREQLYQVGVMSVIGDAAMIQIINDKADCNITLVANETTINDVIQTSADMIIETLSNGQS